MSSATFVESTIDAVRRRRNLRSRLTVAAVLVMAAGAFAARVLLGDFTITIADFFRILFGDEIPGASFILMESKLPRACAAVLAGAAFGASGACFQSLLGNPLASPDILGVSSGASAFAVTGIVLFGLSGGWVALAGAVGAVGIAGLLLLAGGGFRMILVGIGLNAATNAAIQWVLLRANIYQASDAMVWISGSVGLATWPQVAILSMAVALALPALILLGRLLPVLELGDDPAIGLGVPAQRLRIAVLLIAVLLTAVATAFCGPIAFVALLAGQIGRRLQRGRLSIATAAATGAAIVLIADYVGTYVLGNLPVGVVTGAAGAPFLLWLLTRKEKK